MEFLRALLNGRKRYFKNDSVRKVNVPRYKQLTLSKVLDHCIAKPELLRYIPNFPMGGEVHVDRDFLFTIVNTLDPQFFPAQLRAIEEVKREKCANVEEDIIEVKPEIMELLNAFDCPLKSSRGSSRALCMLKKNSKKRRRPPPPSGETHKDTGTPCNMPTKRVRPST